MGAESFRIAFEDLIDSMEDETAETIIPNSVPAATQQPKQVHPPALSFEPTSWQQKVLKAEAKLQGVQQDLTS